MTEVSYQEQLKRTKRWYEIFQQLNQGLEHEKNSEFYKDYVYSFFQNCYHLKDWLKNDKSIKIDKEELEVFVNNCKGMKICKGICNGSKHLISKNPRIGESSYFMVLEAGKKPVISVKYNIEANGESQDAFSLASECMREWQYFFKKNNLIY